MVFLLYVAVPPRIIPFEFSSSPIFSGQSVQITCLLSEGDAPLEIFWEYKGASEGVSTHKLGKQGSTLLIDDVDFEHRGNYTCYAKNVAGIVSYSDFLNVHGKCLISSRARSAKIKKIKTAYACPACFYMRALIVHTTRV